MSEQVSAARPLWVGQRVRRVEDPRFLTGQGRYVADLQAAGLVHVAFVRSPHAHARIKKIDLDGLTGSAEALAVVTGKELAAHRIWVRTAQGPQGQPPMPALALETVHYVGQPVAAVVARDRYIAEDLAELIGVEYEPLPAVVSPLDALRDEAPAHQGRSTNLVMHDERWPQELDEVFRTAPVVVRETLRHPRLSHMPMETRGLMAAYTPGTRHLTVHMSTQMAHTMRDALALIFGLSEAQVRVITPDVGGGFGLKAAIFPEDVATVYLAMQLGRPVKWISDRRESFLADAHARDTTHVVAAAFDRAGNWLALADQMVSTVGAFPFPRNPGGVLETALAAQVLAGPYKIRHYGYKIDVVLTNTAPTGPYRGVHGPAATWAHEAMIERAARALGSDRVQLRRQNMVTKDEFPYQSVTGALYDPGSYIESLDAAMTAIDYNGFAAEQQRARADGRLIGLGIANYLELTAPGIFRDHLRQHHIPYDSATVRMEPSGHVAVWVGVNSHGQGHATTIAQIVADELSLDLDRVHVYHGDTAAAPYGQGTAASRSITMGGGAAKLAAAAVREKLVQIAALMLEAAPADVELVQGGQIQVRGAPQRAVSVAEAAHRAYRVPQLLPAGMQPRLEETRSYSPQAAVTFANGCHAAVVEVDPATGRVTVLRYLVAKDCGVVINPAVVDGQVRGGVAQGIGSAFLEQIVYDEAGQLLTTTWMDYLLPTVRDVPRTIEFVHLQTPSAHPGGMKGAGEGGMVGTPAALAGAVENALSHLGVSVAELNLHPEKVLGLLQQSPT